MSKVTWRFCSCCGEELHQTRTEDAYMGEPGTKYEGEILCEDCYLEHSEEIIVKRKQDWAIETGDTTAHFVNFSTGKALCGRKSIGWKPILKGNVSVTFRCCSICLPSYLKILERKGTNH